jgi:hypothetical protein
LDVEGPDNSYVTSFEPWALDGNPTNDKQQVAFNMFGHWSVFRDPSPQNVAWWQEREALRYIGQLRCAYMRVQAEWDHAQPPNLQWPGFDYPPRWFPRKHTVDMINAATNGTTPWTRVNGSSLGNEPNRTYSREAPPIYYSGAFSSHQGEELALVREMIALDFGSTDAEADRPHPRAGMTLAASPNPSRVSTRLRYSLAAGDRVQCAVFDLQGRKVRTLALGWKEAGEHVLDWDGHDDASRNLPSGVYLTRLQTSATNTSTKLILLR